MDWFTKININDLDNKITLDDKVTMLGSCFVNEVGALLADNGLQTCINPYGTMYNPISVIESLTRISNNTTINITDIINISKHSTIKHNNDNFLDEDSKYCSFLHHSSLAANTPQEYTNKANEITHNAHKHFTESRYIVLTFGTAWVYRHIADNKIVSNCHKINPKEFTREQLSVEFISEYLEAFINKFPCKKFILTISPIRHLKDTAHGNQVSKSILLLAINKICSKMHNTYYFPSYEIMLDELRDYRFYADDMIHPSKQAIEYIFNKFKEACINPNSYNEMANNLKKVKRERHLNIK